MNPGKLLFEGAGVCRHIEKGAFQAAFRKVSAVCGQVLSRVRESYRQLLVFLEIRGDETGQTGCRELACRDSSGKRFPSAGQDRKTHQ